MAIIWNGKFVSYLILKQQRYALEALLDYFNCFGLFYYLDYIISLFIGLFELLTSFSRIFGSNFLH